MEKRQTCVLISLSSPCVKNPHLYFKNVLQEGSYIVLVIKLGIKFYLIYSQRFTARKKARAAVSIPII